MKIVIANKFFYPRGGDCIHTIQLKELLESKGHEVAIFSMHFPENMESAYSEYWPTEVSFQSISPAAFFSAICRPFGVSEVKKKWRRLLNDFQPDIVHLHNIHSQLSPIIAKIAKDEGIPIVWTLHDYKLLCPTSAFLDIKGKVCEDCLTTPKTVIKKNCVKGNKLASWIGYYEKKKWNANILSQFTSLFIAPSLFLRNKMIQGGYSPDKIIHLYNFTDKDKFESPIVNERDRTIVYVGRISLEKGVETLCKSFREIKNAKLQIIGDGPLRKQLQEKYFSDNIEFMGFQQWTVIKELLRKASFLVIPSEWYENNPLTIIEAFAVGTPVLGSNIGGIPELIFENENGMIFNTRDEVDLSQKLSRMLNFNRWNYQQIKLNAKLRFSAKLYYDNLIEIYSSFIK